LCTDGNAMAGEGDQLLRDAARPQKRDAKNEDPKDMGFLEALDKAISIPCLAGSISGLLLFTVLGSIAYNQIGKTGGGGSSQVPVMLKPSAAIGRWKINKDQPTAWYVKDTNFLPNGLMVRTLTEIQDREVYAAGTGSLHAVDQLREYQSDLLRTHGKMMAQVANGPDIGPFMSVFRPPQRRVHGILHDETTAENQLVLLPSGTMMLFTVHTGEFGSILMSRIHLGLDPGAQEAWRRGGQWSERVPVVEHRGAVKVQPRHPSAFYDPHAKVVRLFYSGFVDKSNDFVYMISSSDEGATWTWPEQVYRVPGCFPMGHTIRPSYSEYVIPIMKDGVVKVLRSEDNMLSVKEFPVVEDPRITAVSMVQLANNNLLAYYTTLESDYMRIVESKDNGRTWSESVRLDIPHAGYRRSASHSAFVLRSGKVALLFINHPPVDPGVVAVRAPLSIAISKDPGGRLFSAVRDIEMGAPKDLGQDKGVVFPTGIQAEDNVIHVAYGMTQGNRPDAFVKYVAIDEEWVQNGKNTPNRGVFRGIPEDTW